MWTRSAGSAHWSAAASIGDCDWPSVNCPLDAHDGIFKLSPIRSAFRRYLHLLFVQRLQCGGNIAERLAAFVADHKRHHVPSASRRDHFQVRDDTADCFVIHFRFPLRRNIGYYYYLIMYFTSKATQRGIPSGDRRSRTSANKGSMKAATCA